MGGEKDNLLGLLGLRCCCDVLVASKLEFRGGNACGEIKLERFPDPSISGIKPGMLAT